MIRINSGPWSGDLQILQEHRGNQLIHQNSAMLRVIPELHDVEVAVIRFDQVGLSPAAHFSDMPTGVERH